MRASLPATPSVRSVLQGCVLQSSKISSSCRVEHMGRGLGDRQIGLLEIVGEEWMTTSEVARRYKVSPSERNMYRTMVCSLDGLVKKGRLEKKHDYGHPGEGRVVASWRVNPDYVAAVPATPKKAEPAFSPRVDSASKKPSKAPPSKRPATRAPSAPPIRDVIRSKY